MADDFKYDVFLSHSSIDKAVVRDVAERLRGDGLRVWFDDWEIRPGDSITAKIEAGLEHSRVLVLCLSAQAFGSDWAQLEAGTFRFRDPLNQRRRFIPLWLDYAPIKGFLTQFLSIHWLPQDREQEDAHPGAPGLPPTSEAAGGAKTGRAKAIIEGGRSSPKEMRPVSSARRTHEFWDAAPKLIAHFFKDHAKK